jgi:uncharacterized integral membrane protein (TIGR00698 family)
MRETVKLIEVARELPVSRKNLQMLLLLLLCGAAAYIINLADPALEPLFLALVFGIVAGNLQRDEEKKRVVERYVPFLLPIGITLYGVNINIPYLGEFHPEIVAATLISASLIFLTVFWLSSRLKLSRQMSILLACGSGICGVSAIAIISPLIKPRKEEFSAAIMIITAVGLTGAILYPSIAHYASISPDEFAVLAGATLHQTGIVKISSQLFGVEEEALAIKGIRIAMIAFVVLILSIIYSESRFYVPWYIVSFLGVALFSSTYLPGEVVQALRPLATVMFATTLAAIGYTVNVGRVQRVGVKPLFASYAGWGVGVAFVLLLLGSGAL